MNNEQFRKGTVPSAKVNQQKHREKQTEGGLTYNTQVVS